MKKSPGKTSMLRSLTALTSFGLVACFGCATCFDTHPRQGKKMTVHLDWTEADPFPWTYNGGVTGRVGDYVVYVTGFGRRVPEELKKQPGYFDGYHRLLATYHIPTGRWEQAQPLFPGIARAYANCSVSDGRYAYILGGQSYAPPYCFRDAYRLSRSGPSWQWERLPDMPVATAEFGCALLNGRLYVQGGSHYDKAGPHKGWDSREGNVGRRFAVLDLNRLDEGWRRLPDLPGTHRSHHAMAAVRGMLYLFGGEAGVGGDTPKYWNNVDNWRYDPGTEQWRRIRDLPFPCGGWSARVFQDRYVLLFGGFYGRPILNIDGSTRPPYGCDKAAFSSRVLVYDTETNEFSEATPMPRAINDTRLVWLDSHTVMAITGEVPGSRRIPCVFVGRISMAPARRPPGSQP